MKRVNISFPDGLYKQMKSQADLNNQSLSEYVKNKLREILERERQERIKKSYQELKEIDGIGDKKIKKQYEALDKLKGAASGRNDDPMLSQSIDEILYGENGAWRGEK